MRETQPVVLPATSTTRVSSVCSPVPVTVAMPVSPFTTAGDAVDHVLDARHAGAGCGVGAVHGDVAASCARATRRRRWCCRSAATVSMRTVWTRPAGVVAVAVGEAGAQRVRALAGDGDGDRAGADDGVGARVLDELPLDLGDAAAAGVGAADRDVDVDAVVTQPAGTVVVSTGPAESTKHVVVGPGAHVAGVVDDAMRSVCVPLAVISITSPLLTGTGAAVELVEHARDAGLVAQVRAGQGDRGLVVLPAGRHDRGVDRDGVVDAHGVRLVVAVAGGVDGGRVERVRAGAR